jgi:hypothetical protein
MAARSTNFPSVKCDGLSDSRLRIRHLAVAIALLSGSTMQGFANGTSDALPVSLFFLATGIAITAAVFQSRRPEVRAFILSFAVCILAGGLAQCYSLAVFNNPQSPTDALGSFFHFIAAEPPFRTFASLRHHNAPLAIVIWQQVYIVAWWLKLTFGPYSGVMFNAFVMGIVASFSVATARELFGNGERMLYRVGTLVSFNGLLILLGALLLRDCFTTLLIVLVLWALVRWLARPVLLNLLVAVALISIASYALAYLRAQSVPLLALFGVLALLFWFLGKTLDAGRAVAVAVALGVVLIASPSLARYFGAVDEIRERSDASLVTAIRKNDSERSLAVRYLIDQPLPIRLVMTMGFLAIYPMPLWRFFDSDGFDYHWIKGYNGLFQLVVMPLLILGCLQVFRQFRENRQAAARTLFIFACVFAGIIAVVGTSAEQRHLAPFIPAMMIIAAVPDMRNFESRQSAATIARWWLAAVILIHLLWAALKT